MAITSPYPPPYAVGVGNGTGGSFVVESRRDGKSLGRLSPAASRARASEAIGGVDPILEMVTTNYDRSIHQQEGTYPFVVELARQLGRPHGYLEEN